MSYQALYRKYRPKRFGEIIGQEHITTILLNQVRGALATHAYLFTGTRGTGKTSTAKIFAKAVNCERPNDGEPCGCCQFCLAADDNGADIIELDAASNTGVDDMRSLIDKARFAPLVMRTKVYIIDEAHMLSNNAFNALLKTLEEPPAHILFILATTEPQRIPATIISRCQRFDFHRIGVNDIVSTLSDVLQKAGKSIDEEGMLTIARSAEGGMRDALSIADQCIAFCGDNVTAEDVYCVLGSMSGDFLFEIADALMRNERRRALALMDKVVNDGKDLGVFALDLARHFRALLLAKLCGECADILGCTPDAMRKYIEQAALCGEKKLTRALDILLESSSKLRWLSLPRVQMDCALVRITSPEEERQTVDTLLERVEQLEAAFKNSEFGIRNAALGENSPPVEGWTAKPNGVVAVGAGSVRPLSNIDNSELNINSEFRIPNSEFNAVWEKMKDIIKQEEPVLALIAMKSKVMAQKGETLTVGFDSKAKRDAFMKDENMRRVNAALEKVAPGTKITFGLLSDINDDERVKNVKQKCRSI